MHKQIQHFKPHPKTSCTLTNSLHAQTVWGKNNAPGTDSSLKFLQSFLVPEESTQWNTAMNVIRDAMYCLGNSFRQFELCSTALPPPQLAFEQHCHVPLKGC